MCPAHSLTTYAFPLPTDTMIVCVDPPPFFLTPPGSLETTAFAQNSDDLPRGVIMLDWRHFRLSKKNLLFICTSHLCLLNTEGWTQTMYPCSSSAPSLQQVFLPTTTSTTTTIKSDHREPPHVFPPN